jgi:hypothetical protein
MRLVAGAHPVPPRTANVAVHAETRDSCSRLLHYFAPGAVPKKIRMRPMTSALRAPEDSQGLSRDHATELPAGAKPSESELVLSLV